MNSAELNRFHRFDSKEEVEAFHVTHVARLTFNESDPAFGLTPTTVDRAFVLGVWSNGVNLMLTYGTQADDSDPSGILVDDPVSIPVDSITGFTSLTEDGKYGIVEKVHDSLLEDYFAQHKTGNIVDIGCGPHPSEISNKASLVDRLRGVDISDFTARELRNADLPNNFEFLQADAAHLPFQDNSINLALLFGVYSDYKLGPDISTEVKIKSPQVRTETRTASKLLSLQEIRRTLAPSGILIASHNHLSTPIAQTTKEFQQYFDIKAVHEGGFRYLMVCTPRA